jgi:hypothetical protein
VPENVIRLHRLVIRAESTSPHRPAYEQYRRIQLNLSVPDQLYCIGGGHAKNDQLQQGFAAPDTALRGKIPAPAVFR